MTREEIIRNLKYTMEKHKKDIVNTFDTNISVMCKDILDYLEQEPSRKGLTVCDMCRYNPPSSTDGKPCTMCPAVTADMRGDEKYNV